MTRKKTDSELDALCCSTQSYSSSWFAVAEFGFAVESFSSSYVAPTSEFVRTSEEIVAPSAGDALSYPRHFAVVDPTAPTSSQFVAALQLAVKEYWSFNAKTLDKSETFSLRTESLRRRTSAGIGANDVEMVASSARSFPPEGHGSVGVRPFVFAYQRKCASVRYGWRSHETVQESKVGTFVFVDDNVACRQSCEYVDVESDERSRGLAEISNPDALPGNAASGTSDAQLEPYATETFTSVPLGSVVSHTASPHDG